MTIKPDEIKPSVIYRPMFIDASKETQTPKTAPQTTTEWLGRQVTIDKVCALTLAGSAAYGIYVAATTGNINQGLIDGVFAASFSLCGMGFAYLLNEETNKCWAVTLLGLLGIGTAFKLQNIEIVNRLNSFNIAYTENEKYFPVIYELRKNAIEAERCLGSQVPEKLWSLSTRQQCPSNNIEMCMGSSPPSSHQDSLEILESQINRTSILNTYVSDEITRKKLGNTPLHHIFFRDYSDNPKAWLDKNRDLSKVVAKILNSTECARFVKR